MPWVAAEFSEAAKLRIKEAASFEKKMRLESFLSIETTIGEFKLITPTIRHCLMLEYGENSLVTGGNIRIDDILTLLWILRPESENRSQKRFFEQSFENLDDFAKDEIISFFHIQYNDIPLGVSENVNDFDSSVSMTTLIDSLCHEYGWSLEQALDTKLSVALQLFQRIIKRHNPKYAIRNGITQDAKAKELSE
jgi:hypothetical protein